MIETKVIKTYKQLKELMPFFLEGFEAIRSKYKFNIEVDEDGFVKTLIGVINSYPRNGILVAYHENKPVGYGVGFDGTMRFSATRTLLLWALYSKGIPALKVPQKLLEKAEEWAKEQGYEQMDCFSARFSGAGIDFFEKKLGFKKAKIYYIKELT